MKNNITNINELFISLNNDLTSENLISLIEQKKTLRNLPLEPLYFAISNVSMETLGEMLPLLSKVQRKGLWHIDFWEKDEIYPEEAKKWIVANFYNQDEVIKREFVLSSEFLLFIKTIFNIWTFDYDDPDYPEHNNYFLTDDALLLFEFKEEDDKIAAVVKMLIIEMYSLLGMENAYTHLFKIVATSFILEEEELYKYKCSLMEEFGLISHHESLQLISPFPNIKSVNYTFFKNKTSPHLNTNLAKQTLTKGQIELFNKDFDLINIELSKVSCDERIKYLRFNFVKTINASYTLNGGMKAGKIALFKNNKRSRFFIYLGVEYLIIKNEENVLMNYDFSFCYKIGLTLINELQKEVKKSFYQAKFDFEKIDFLGIKLNEKYNCLFEGEFVNYKQTTPYQKYLDLVETKDLLSSLILYAKQLHTSFDKLISDGIIQSGFYFNINVQEIDLENILLSLFFNYRLGLKDIKKIGITINEFKKIYLTIFNQDGTFLSKTDIMKSLSSFISEFGFNSILHFQGFMFDILKNNLEGYLVGHLKKEEFCHVGGVILLIPEPIS